MTVSSLSNQLIVPITLWGSRSPTHCISTLILTADYQTIITGCNDGQICLWDFSKDRNMLTPRSLLFGHTQAVLCLANGKQNSATHRQSHFVSSSETGEMSLWDLDDGRCIETIKLQYVHISIQTYTINDNVRFFCNGYYSEILVIDGLTLEILFTLNSRLSPDWISAIHVLRPARSQDDVVIGLSIAGIMKVWTLSGTEHSSLEPVYENESKPIRCLNAVQLVCCRYNQRTLLIVCAKYWQIYDVGDFALLCSVNNRNRERWSSGDFLTSDTVVICSDVGKAYCYKLPVNCIPDNEQFHNINCTSQPILFQVLSISKDQRLLCPPSMKCFTLDSQTEQDSLVSSQHIVVRGDSLGRLAIWTLNSANLCLSKDVANEQDINKIPHHEPSHLFSLFNAWKCMKTPPCGIMDTLLKNIDDPNNPSKLTSSVYIPTLGRLVCGRDDGSIVIVSANQTIMLQLLIGRHLHYEDWPHHQILYGHSGRVNTLVYPHLFEERYEVSHLISGGVDFSVCLWDIFTGTLLHRFSVHAGEITQMFVPPKDCSPRVLNCICSVASDHSVALISLKERRCIMLASRHIFPISTIKWRPLDDFMIVGCVDGSVYVWQMETGHLDRVLHGMNAEEILNACNGNSMTATGDRSVNPALHLFRGLRHRNLAAIRQAAVRGLHNISAHLQQHRFDVIDGSIKSRSSSLSIQGLRTNHKDQESHILFFDVESLIVQILSEEYDQLTPNSLENMGLTSNLEYKRYADMSCSPDTQHKLSGFLTKMKDTAENAAQKIQAKAESVGFKNVTSGDISVGFQIRKNSTSTSQTSCSTPDSGLGPRISKQHNGNMYISDTHMPMEIARLLLSLLHAWGLDPDLDKVCEQKLGLLKPLRSVCFGMLSKSGFMSLMLPTYLNQLDDELCRKNASTQNGSIPNFNRQPVSRTKSDKHVKIASSLPNDLLIDEEMARRFTSILHWELSTPLTTTHLLSLIALANTLMTMSNGSMFASSEASNRRKLIRKLSRQGSSSHQQGPVPPSSVSEDNTELKVQRQQIRDGWSLLAALHCVLLPEMINSTLYKRPLVELLARRWQDRCIEIREAAQALLLAELRSAGPKGRRQIVEEWSSYLPSYDQVVENSIYGSTGQATGTGGHTSVASSQQHSIASTPISTPMSEQSGHPSFGANTSQMNNHGNVEDSGDNLSDTESVDGEGDDANRGSGTSNRGVGISAPNSSSEGRRKQATSIILMGVIGAEYGAEIEINTTPKSSAKNVNNNNPTLLDPAEVENQLRRRSSVVEGFGGGGNYLLARKTSKALSYLVLAAPTPSLPYHTSLRRAAIDLIGRGFTVWEPYLDISKILLALLEFCSYENEQNMIPSNSFGLPLTPAADSCRTARHAIMLIAAARPAVFITTLAKEVTRFNSMQQQQQSINLIPHHTVLYRSRPEILRIMEMLIDKHSNDVYTLIIEAMDIVLYALDSNALKSRGLTEIFPAICRFQNVTSCTSSKRVAVGTRNGGLAIYELKTGKYQLIQSHSGAVTACSFAPDGKHLASYSSHENKVSFWLTAVGLFGLGNAQTRCIKSHASPPMSDAVKALGPLKSAKLIWVSTKLIILLFADGKEHRFNV